MCVLQNDARELPKAEEMLAVRCRALEALARISERAEPASGFGARLLGRESLAHELLGACLEVEEDLFVRLVDGRPGAAKCEAEMTRRARRKFR